MDFTSENRSLNELEKPWGTPPSDATPLMQKVYALRNNKPLSSLTVEDIRVLVTQRVSLDIVLPIAKAILQKNPQAEGDTYPGDLKDAVDSVERPNK